MEGGSCNDYDYVCGDPVNNLDLDGTHCRPWHPHHCVGAAAGAIADLLRGDDGNHGEPSRDESILNGDPCASETVLCAKGGRQNKRLTGDQEDKENTPEQLKRKGLKRSSGGDGRGTQKKKPKKNRDTVSIPCGPALCQGGVLEDIYS